MSEAFWQKEAVTEAGNGRSSVEEKATMLTRGETKAAAGRVRWVNFMSSLSTRAR